MTSEGIFRARDSWLERTPEPPLTVAQLMKVVEDAMEATAKLDLHQYSQPVWVDQRQLAALHKLVETSTAPVTHYLGRPLGGLLTRPVMVYHATEDTLGRAHRMVAHFPKTRYTEGVGPQGANRRKEPR